MINSSVFVRRPGSIGLGGRPGDLGAICMTEDRRGVRVLISAEHASARFGGEAILPLHIFRGLRRRGVEAWLVVHGRTRDELAELMPAELDRVHFIPDGWAYRLLHRLGLRLPERVGHFSTGWLSRLLAQREARRVARRLVAEHRVDVVHQPIPVSPREPSLLFDVGAPVVIGPMNGGMSYPPGFRERQGRSVGTFLQLGRRASDAINRLLPGKLRARVLLVANDRTRRALPRGVRGEVRALSENGVDLALWRPAVAAGAGAGPTRVVFVGRLIDCKAVDLLLEAFRDLLVRAPATLAVAGDGPIRGALEARAEALGLGGSVRFLGWLPQDACADLLRRSDLLVLPSLHECGGAVILEAMGAGLPVVATDWGGPADYLDESCGILVEPTSREGFVRGLADAMHLLAVDPDRRAAMGRAGRERVARHFDWDRKIDALLDLYAGLVPADREAATLAAASR